MAPFSSLGKNEIIYIVAEITNLNILKSFFTSLNIIMLSLSYIRCSCLLLYTSQLNFSWIIYFCSSNVADEILATNVHTDDLVDRGSTLDCVYHINILILVRMFWYA